MKAQGLYDPRNEHDSCGVGFVANVDGKATHKIITEGLTILNNLAHRGAIGGDLKTGDGGGILCQIPHKFFTKELKKQDMNLPKPGAFGMGMLFLPQKDSTRKTIISIIKKTVVREGGKIIAWRDVPTMPDCLGQIALDAMPFISQIFLTVEGLEEELLERKLYVLRRCIENEVEGRGFSIDNFYISSLSAYTVVYKGMFLAYQVKAFYPDLSDSDFCSAIALVHQRYSTNTFPAWHLAQPFRFLAHNGEINTLRGNINKMKAREATLESGFFGNDIHKLVPLVNDTFSDSANIDLALELLYRSGRSLPHSMMMLIPEAFGMAYHASRDKKAFYEYHAAMMEPWDGPAGLAFTDGKKVGATLDRNGLRPARYVVTKQGKIVYASEVGVLPINPEDVLQKGRLAPGKMILVDTEKGRILFDNEIKSTISRQKPYRRWLNNNRIELKGLFQTPRPVEVEPKSLKIRQKAFGYTLEDVKAIIAPMAINGQEPISSMGNDVPLAVLSERSQLIYNYFKQLFAQVTNPPIDPYREHLVMSLMSFIGRERNLMEESPEHCQQLKLPHPILTNEDMDKLRSVDIEGLKAATIPIFFKATGTAEALKRSLKSLCYKVEAKVNQGHTLIILSDRGADEYHIPIPALLAVSTVHHHLIKAGKRQLTGIIVESGEARDVQHFGLLIGYGASAINPYLTFETIADLYENNKLPANLKAETATENYITAVKKGLLKIMSKMGVSTIRSYRGAQIYEAVGLGSELVDKYFCGTPTKIEGIGLGDIAKEAKMRHQKAFAKAAVNLNVLEPGGDIHFRLDSEKHGINAEVIHTVHKAMRTGDYSLYKEYAKAADDNERNLCTLRGLFKFKKSDPVPLEEVEPASEIVKRFVTGAMSFGSISKEAHESIAIAMNRLGAASNSGEGGEDEARYILQPNGDSKKSMIKQVASGRFGVTSHYLVNAKEIQIKMAQGAKPGEGGQLPGHKVDSVIARVRHSTPGVMLISPPPHHDIYSIEDLAQLIFDLKNANLDARVSVKLVSEVGVGTVAAGVAKGKADMVLISGYDGGTGASPLSSIKHAGMPWEIGLAETQQTLILNQLRDKIRVQVDGKIKTGRDVVIGALLGAEEFGFGTMALVSMGCIMMRKCHLNTCPVGVATQDERLRKRFSGDPQNLVNYMMFVAEHVRELMAELGFRKFEDMVGRVEKLDTNDALKHWKSKGLDFTNVFAQSELPEGQSHICTIGQQHDFTYVIDDQLIKMSEASLKSGKKVGFSHAIANCNRTVGAILSSEVSKRYGSKGLPDKSIHCKFTGSAGQSFGAFLAKGIFFELEGDANDYLGKGLSGGIISLYPDKKSTFRPQNNIITGNVNLFGATKGEVYINGMAGERFAVRNSGATAVVEGVGDHGCEYMTGGIVVVLGKTGVNFAAGMSGGIAYVFDEDQLFDTKCNLEMVDVEPLTNQEDENQLKSLITKHIKYTKSKYAARFIKDWSEVRMQFVKVMPIDYRAALERMKKEEMKESEEVALTEEIYR